MKIFDKIKERQKHWETKIYETQEKALVERLETAKERKIREDRLNTLRLQINKLEPKKKASGGKFIENVLKNSYRNLDDYGKKRKKGTLF